eukprot:TRINITY_DN377682_c0_g1_i1.p1 TRINITY_DN377682_c0_g1~~TRINITY_DN377682_c0_g1_i1.p1  ORF type:complete len:359 (-),score=135.13 TRINITY_DN377682_c0_g1_i1:129-1205(-)
MIHLKRFSSFSSFSYSFSTMILGIGNPLLDISTETPSTYATKYDIDFGDCKLAEEKHMPVYDDLRKNFDVTYIAGGACQNSIRTAKWALRDTAECHFMGCIGDDEYGELLKKTVKSDGVQAHYLVDKDAQTGKCAVMVHEGERALLPYLGAANNYNVDHIKSEEMTAIMEKSDLIYMCGFFLTVSPETVKLIGEHCIKTNKTFAFNLSALFIMEFFGEKLDAALPYVNVLFANETEAKCFAETHNIESSDMKEIAKAMAELPKEFEGSRTVVITQGADPTVVCEDGKVTEYETPALSKEELIDTNGAGDAFVGGFLAKYLKKGSIASCVKKGCATARVVIQNEGCQFGSEAIEESESE